MSNANQALARLIALQPAQPLPVDGLLDYDAVLRFRINGPLIWQITASGLKNEFPRTLLGWFDRLNL